MTLSLSEPVPAWSASAVRVTRGASEALFGILGPQVAGAAASGRERAARWIGRRAPGTWPLLDVVEHEGRSVWLYPAHAGVSAAPLVDGALVPLRVAVALVRAVADALDALGPDGLAHPGPMPEDVVIDPAGEVHVLGFVAPTAPDPSRHDPNPADAAAALTYRLGVLLAELLSGGSLAPSSSPAAHESAVRRVIIRAMARPQVDVPERLRDLLSSMLAWEAHARPTLATARVALRGLEGSLPGPTLADWAAAEVRARRDAALPGRAGHRTTAEYDTGSMRPDDPRLTLGRTLPNLHTFVDHDDVTAVSEGSRPRTVPPPEFGVIPVAVGPPAEAARRRPTLPSDIFAEEGPVSGAPPPAGLPGWVVAAAILAVLAALLAIYVFTAG